MWCHLPLALPVLGLVLFLVLPWPVAATRRAWAGQMAVGVVLLLAAGLLTAQFLTERSIRRTVGVGSPRLQEIAYRLQREEAEQQNLEQQMTALREQVAGLARAVAEDQVILRP